MKNDGVFTDRRLLQAIDLIDPKFIAEVFDDLKVPDTSKGYVSDKRGLHRAYRQFLALAACLILLSAAFPIAHYVLVNYDFQAGGWGSESAAETTNGTYDKYILTEDDLAELNEAYSNWIKGALFADSIEEAMTQKTGGVYIGKFGECIVFVYADNPAIDLYADSFWVCYQTEIISLEEAVTKELISSRDLDIINDIYETNIKPFTTRRKNFDA